MADIVIPINKTVDISKGTLYTTLGLQNTHDQLIQGQSYANVLNVSVYDGAEPIALSGACMGYFVRQQDGSTVTVAGTISGNVASVEFPSFVYAYTGRLTITLNVGGTSLVQIATTVRLGATMVVVDPGNALPNLDEIRQIMLDVESALNQLSSALTASQQATQAANTAAGAANTAAQGANNAARAANTAALALNGMTVAANTLEPGEPATAVAELVSGAWKITFGIPQGVQGIQGVRGTVAWHGTAITGTSTTPTAYPTGIDSAIAGDLYLYSGTDVANIGNVYTCTQGGDASTALWAYMANWRGATGAGSVSSVNSVLPNADGDVELTAADVGARPDTWTPDGLIYETTAQALEAMSQEQQAALYAQGYRAIVATYNETVTMHALAADGSLAWIGCNQDTTNLLDNSDFTNPVNQRGQTAYTSPWAMSIDRWYIGNSLNSPQSTTTLTLTASGIHIASNGGGTPYIQTRVQQINENRIHTAAWLNADGIISILTVTTEFIQENMDQYGFIPIKINPGEGATLVWAALYEGEYTKKTLPPWVAPDPSVELLKCMAYYQTIKSFYLSGANTSIRISPPMRLTPTVTGVAQEYVSGSGWEETENVTFSASNNDNIRLYAYDANSKTYAVSLSLVADL